MSDEIFWRVKEVTRQLGISRSSLYQGIREGRYPPPLRLGKRTSVFIPSQYRKIAEDLKPSVCGKKSGKAADLND